MPCRAMAAIRRRQDWSCPLGSPFGPSEKGIMVWRSRLASAAGYELAGRTRPEQRGAALDRSCATASPDVATTRPGSRELSSAPTRPRSDASGARIRGLGRGLSRARRQPRLADASRRFAVAGARVDRCARLRRCASMGFDGPSAPSGRTSASKPMKPRAVMNLNRYRIDPLTITSPYEPGDGGRGQRPRLQRSRVGAANCSRDR